MALQANDVPAISTSIAGDLEAIFALSSMLEEKFRFDHDTLRSESTASLRTLQDTRVSAQASTTGKNSVVDSFLADDNGLPLLTGLEAFRIPSKSRPPPSGFSLSRIRSAPTASSIRRPSVVNDPSVTLPLDTLCDLIDRYATLERAEIISVEVYKEWTAFGVLHRFLVLQLRRPKRSDIWIRLDRRASSNVTFPRITRTRKLEAVDSVNLAASKSDLLNGQRAKSENQLTFTGSCNLGAFRFFVSVISDELRNYRAWPENSWQLCSLVQEYLAAVGKGQFVIGTALYFGLTGDIRSRIYNRIYHVPQGSTMVQLFQSVTVSKNSYWGATFLPKAISLGKTYDSSSNSTQADSIPEQKVIDVCEALRVLAPHANPDEGCLLASRAAALYYQLAVEDPDTHTERYIASLQTHVDRLAAANRHEDACDTLKQIVQIYRNAYEEYPRASTTKLANSIRAYCKEVGRSGPVTKERNPLADLLDIYQELYKRDPDKWVRELDESISACIDQVLKAGRIQDACSASSRIVAMHRVRYDADPKTHWTHFATSLQAYVERLFRGRRASEALDSSRELMRIYRSLWKNHSKIHRLYIAESLEAYAQRLFRVRRPADAILVLFEIVEMYRARYVSAPDLHHTSLAESLNGYADGLTVAGRPDEACAASLRIVEMYRELCNRDPVLYHADLARAMNGQAERFHTAGRDNESWSVRVGLVDMYRVLDRTNPGVYHREIAAALNACAEYLSKGGHLSQACDASLEVVELYRRLYDKASLARYRELNKALSLYADRLAAAKRFDDACAASLEMVDVDRALYADDKENHAWDMAASLDAHAARLSAAGRNDEACSLSLEAVMVDRNHKTAQPTVFREEERITRLYNCSRRLATVARYNHALEMGGEALESLGPHKDSPEGPPEWVVDLEARLKKVVQDVLLVSSKSGGSDSRPPTAQASTSQTRQRRSSSTSSRKIRLGWEINRWKAQKVAEGKRPSWL